MEDFYSQFIYSPYITAKQIDLIFDELLRLEDIKLQEKAQEHEILIEIEIENHNDCKKIERVFVHG